MLPQLIEPELLAGLNVMGNTAMKKQYPQHQKLDS